MAPFTLGSTPIQKERYRPFTKGAYTTCNPLSTFLPPTMCGAISATKTTLIICPWQRICYRLSTLPIIRWYLMYSFSG